MKLWKSVFPPPMCDPLPGCLKDTLTNCISLWNTFPIEILLHSLLGDIYIFLFKPQPLCLGGDLQAQMSVLSRFPETNLVQSKHFVLRRAEREKKEK